MKHTTDLSKTFSTIQRMHSKDRQRDQQRLLEVEQLTELPLERILSRPHGDIRPVSNQHVEELAYSISVVGLIQPMAVDKKGRLLAGAHRLAALQRIQSEAPEVFKRLFPSGMIPVRMMVELDASEQRQQARVIELEENEKRKAMSKAQVMSLAHELKRSGYHFSRGRPKEGVEGSLGNALVLASGKSLSTIRRWLAEQLKSTAQDDFSQTQETDKSKRKVLRRLKREVQSAYEALSACEGHHPTLMSALEQVITCIRDERIV